MCKTTLSIIKKSETLSQILSALAEEKQVKRKGNTGPHPASVSPISAVSLFTFLAHTAKYYSEINADNIQCNPLISTSAGKKCLCRYTDM